MANVELGRGGGREGYSKVGSWQIMAKSCARKTEPRERERGREGEGECPRPSS